MTPHLQIEGFRSSQEGRALVARRRAASAKPSQVPQALAGSSTFHYPHASLVSKAHLQGGLYPGPPDSKDSPGGRIYGGPAWLSVFTPST